MNSSRLAAARALLKVFRDGGYSNLTTDSAFGELSPRDRAFASALFFGVLERAVTLDWAMGCYSKTKVAEMTPAVRELLRCGFYQLLYMPSVPHAAAVNETVALAKELGEGGASGFVNGVLRGFLRGNMTYPLPKDKLLASAVTSGVPAPLISMWRKAYGPQRADALLGACQTPPPIFARVNTRKTTAAKLIEILKSQGVEARLVEAGPDIPHAIELIDAGNPAAIPAFEEGLFHIQDIASQRCSHLLRAEPGMEVLDLCAAPGGKTFTIAQEMGDTGWIVAQDLYPNRVKLVEEGARRLGLSSISAVAGDAQSYNPDLGSFHRVLCDVVCSGYGVLRRKPEIRYKDPKGLDGIREPQYNILCTASHYLRAGGLLVYSTCTLRPQENEEIVTAFLAEHPGFTLARPMETHIPGWDGWRGDGFFTAVMTKNSQ